MPPFRPPHAVRAGEGTQRAFLIALLIGALYLGRDVLAPLALALLLTIAVTPVAAWLERRGLPRVPAVLTVLLLVLATVAFVLWVVTTQTLALAAELPRYESTLRAKLESLAHGSGVMDEFAQLAKRLAAAVRDAPAAEPVPVVIDSGPAGPVAGLLAVVAAVIGPVGSFGIALLLMAFILVQREDVRDRALRLAGLHELHRTTRAMTEAGDRLSRFLLMQAAMNAVFGASMGVGLWLLGVPNAPLWGVLGLALRFIPFVGAPVSVLFPLVLAFATTEGWWTVVMVLLLFAVVDLVVTYALEPWLYGASTGLSPLALLLAATFWAILWGPLGLILAPALTACALILGRHVPGLGFLQVLLGEGAALPAETRFYQRLLAEDDAGAARILAAEGEPEGARAAIEGLVLPALRRIAAERPGEGFGPALAVRGARTLLRALEIAGDEPESDGEIRVVPLAGALDRAGAVAVVALLAEAGHAAALDVAAPRAVVVVAVAETPPHRVRRAAREAARRGLPHHFLALTPEGARTLAALPHHETIESLGAALDAALAVAEVA